MLTATVTSKGQITLPVELRRQLRITTGTQVEFIPDESGHYRLRPKTGRARDLAGILPPPATPASLDDMEDGIARGAADGDNR